MLQAKIQNWNPAEKLTAMILTGLLCVCIGAGIWYYQRHVVYQGAQSLKHVTSSMAQTQVTAINHYLGSLQQDMRRFTGRQAFSDAVSKNDPVIIRSFMSSLEKAFPKAISIRIIPSGTAQVNREHKAPIRFAELDMITRAENHQPIVIEALKVEQRWQFNLIAPIPADKASPPVATLMVTLTQSAIVELLKDADPKTGYFELLQQFHQNPAQLITAIGEAHDLQSSTKNIPGTIWKLRFSPSTSTLESARVSIIPFLGIWIIATALILTGSLQLCRKFLLSQYKTSPTQRATVNFDKIVMDHQSKTSGRQMADILDIEVNEDDEDLLGGQSLKQNTRTQRAQKNTQEAVNQKSAPVNREQIPDEVFRAYDIRGFADDYLSDEFVALLGKALGTEAIEQGETTMLVGRDCRTHSPRICETLIEGIISTGCNVIDLGIVPTPLLYFACHTVSTTNSGVVVTASHNGPEYNGFKMVFNRNTISDQGIQYIKQRMQEEVFATSDTPGIVSDLDISEEYIEKIFSDIALAGELSVVIDAGNGATSELAPRLFEELGCKVTPLYCEFDGRFPNHIADPSQERNMHDLIKKVKQTRADLGIAFDGDGDRLGLVTPQGKVIWPDRQLMLFAKDIVSRNPGTDVLFDVKCTRQLNSLISSYGGRPIMWKTGHSLMKAKMQETGALLGGELSGHIFFKERWFGFDDGMYSAARLMEIMTLRDQDLDTIFSSFPELPATPEIRIDVAESEKFQIVKDLIAHGHFDDGRLTTIDGLRVDFAHGWGLVRASNTSAALTLRFEANTPEQLEEIQEQFRVELAKIAPALSF